MFIYVSFFTLIMFLLLRLCIHYLVFVGLHAIDLIYFISSSCSIVVSQWRSCIDVMHEKLAGGVCMRRLLCREGESLSMGSLS